MLSHHSDLVSQSLFNMSSKFSVQKYVNMWYAPHRCEWSSLKQVESNDEILSIAGMHTYKNLCCIKLLASATLVPSAGILTQAKK